MAGLRKLQFLLGGVCLLACLAMVAARVPEHLDREGLFREDTAWKREKKEKEEKDGRNEGEEVDDNGGNGRKLLEGRQLLAAVNGQCPAGNAPLPSVQREKWRQFLCELAPLPAASRLSRLANSAALATLTTQAGSTGSPDPACGTSWSKVVLLWEGSVNPGVQFDRYSGLWLGGVELVRSTTPEPVGDSPTTWRFEKDVTVYSAWLTRGHPYWLELDNCVGTAQQCGYSTDLTGTFTVTVTLLFYPASASAPAPAGLPDTFVPLLKYTPDISASWFSYGGVQVTFPGTLEGGAATPPLPKNITRMVLEVSASAHDCEEFWYMNPPQGATLGQRCSGSKGAFHELEARLNSTLVGTSFLFPTMYTGALNPLLWRPFVSPGAFLLPTYSLELTPYAGLLKDGFQQSFDVQIAGSVPGGFWLVAATLQLWTDPQGDVIAGGVTQNSLSSAQAATQVNKGLLSEQYTQTAGRQGYTISGTLTRADGTVQKADVSGSMSFSSKQTYTPSLAMAMKEDWTQQQNFEASVTITATAPGSSQATTVVNKKDQYSWPMDGSYSTTRVSVSNSKNDVSSGTGGTLNNKQVVNSGPLVSCKMSQDYRLSSAAACYHDVVSVTSARRNPFKETVTTGGSC